MRKLKCPAEDAPCDDPRCKIGFCITRWRDQIPPPPKPIRTIDDLLDYIIDHGIK